MLRQEDFGTIFLIMSLLGSLIIASPALAFVLPPRVGERFSELYILGPNHMAEDYPFNIKADETYKIYLGVANHMASSTYYALYVKFRNQTEPLPNSTNGTPSPLPALYEYRLLLSDGGVWEAPLTLSFENFTISGNNCVLESLTINDIVLHVDKMVSWDSENEGFFLQIFFELWTYDTEGFRFHDRFVGIWLNMTA